MSLTWFSRPIPVQWGSGVTRNVSSLEAAGELLLDLRWPKQGSKYQAAVRAVLEGATDLEGAEKAFAAAAKEAGILRLS